MNSHSIVQRLRAYQQSRPLPRGETLHFRVGRSSDILRIAFIRMGGESAPWAIGFAHPGHKPEILSVPEPRNRDLVADMVGRFAPILLKHLRHPEHSNDKISDAEYSYSVRQVWLPNATHLDMLHHLAYAYTFTKWGSEDRAKLLNQLGRATNWLFQEAHRPGQQTVMVSTETLREAFTFPAEDTRQGHLGFLLAWLLTSGERSIRFQAAAEAERVSVSTSLDPALERDELNPRIDRWNEANRSGDSKSTTDIAEEIRRVLEPEVQRRLQLLEQCVDLLRSDERRMNAGIPILESANRAEHWYRYIRLERRISDEADGPAFVPSPETDRFASAAAARFFIHEESEELRYSVLVHDDSEVQADAVAAGEAFQGTIVKIQDANPRERRTVPRWTIESSDTGPLRLREGSYVCPAGIPKRTGIIVSIAQLPNGNRSFVVEITGWKRAQSQLNIPESLSPKLIGTRVLMVRTASDGLARRRGLRVWQRSIPGSWLTHGRPGGQRAKLPPEIAEDLPALANNLESN
jgi:hypothetical protein